MAISDDELLAFLKTVEPHASDLQPLSPSATPNTKQRRRDVVETAAKISKRMKRTHPDSIDGLTIQEKRDIASIKRVQRILACIGQDKVTGKEFVWMMNLKQDGQFVDVEDAALRRLLVGYKVKSREDWETLLHAPGEETTVGDKCERSKIFDEVVELEQCLVDRHVFLSKIDNEETGRGYVALVSKQIDSIKFARDWQDLDDHPTGKKTKTNFFISSFQREHPDVSAYLDNTEKVKKMDQLSRWFKAWKKKNDAVVYSCNRLRHMYLKFGVAVLMDPVWDVKDIVSHRSKTFTDVLMRLLTAIPSNKANDLSPLQDGNEETLLDILVMLADDDMAAHLTEFLLIDSPDVRGSGVSHRFL